MRAGKHSTWNFGVYGILNSDGKPWTSDTFITAAKAERYLADRQRENPKWDLSKHTVVPVSVTIRAVRPSPPTQEPETP